MKGFKVVSLLVGVFSSFCVTSIEYNYSLSADNESSDNITQRIDGDSGNATNLGLGFNVISETNIDWDLNVSGNFSKVYFSGDELADDNRKALNAISRYNPDSNNFSLLAIANITQVPLNRFQTQEVNNLRDTNLFAIRPGYFFNLTESDRISINFTSLDFSMENSDDSIIAQDNSRSQDETALTYSKQINATNNLGLVYQQSDSDFDASLADGAVDYEQIDTFARWIVTGGSNQIQVEYGKSEVKDVLLQELDTATTSIAITRQINREQILELNYAEGFDNFIAIDMATDSINVSQQNNDIARVQEIKDSSIAYAYRGTFWQFSASAFQQELKDVFGDREDLRKGYSVNMSYSLSRLLSTPLNSNVTFSLLNTENEFDTNLTDVTQTNNETIRLRYNHSYSQRINFYVELSSRKVEQLNSIQGNQNFKSESLFIGVSYSDRGSL